MTQKIIKAELLERHNIFADYILSLSQEEFMFSYQDKWTAGQQMAHILRSTSILSFALMMPKFITGLIFGRAGRPSMEYEELVQKYRSMLEKGAGAPTLYIPGSIPFDARKSLADRLLKKVSKVIAKMDKYSELEMDRFMLPHPILGRITFREMMYFTIHHVDHHYALAKRYLVEK